MCVCVCVNAEREGVGFFSARLNVVLVTRGIHVEYAPVQPMAPSPFGLRALVSPVQGATLERFFTSSSSRQRSERAALSPRPSLCGSPREESQARRSKDSDYRGAHSLEYRPIPVLEVEL